MPHASDHLRAIHNFDELVLYLEEKLGWPLREYGFDELTFQYDAEELGLKDDDAAKVKAIHQLRPLQHAQPEFPRMINIFPSSQAETSVRWTSKRNGSLMD